MTTISITLAFTTQPYAPGTTTTGTQITLNAPAGVPAVPAQTIAPGQTSVSFDAVPPGAGYTASAQLLDGSGAPLGVAATSVPFDVPAPNVDIPTPSVITVTVAA